MKTSYPKGESLSRQGHQKEQKKKKEKKLIFLGKGRKVGLLKHHGWGKGQKKVRKEAPPGIAWIKTWGISDHIKFGFHFVYK